MKKRLWVLVGLMLGGYGAAGWPETPPQQEFNPKAQNESNAPLKQALLLSQQAVKLYKEGKYAEAEPLFQNSLKIREKALGSEHPDVAKSLNNLAVLYKAQGQYAAAEPLFQRSLKIREKALGPEHPDVATSLNDLAMLYKDQGQYAAAEPLFQRSLKIREKALGAEHPDVAQSLNNLAALYETQGQYAAAEPLYQRSLKILEKALGPEHPDVATSLNNLAELYRAQGQYAAAEPLYQRSLTIREKALGPKHPDVAQSLNNLGVLYHYWGQYAAAEPLYQRSFKAREKALGSEHPAVATSLNNLAALYQDQGQYAAAEAFYRRSLTIREKALGPEHPDVAVSLGSLASLYRVQGQYTKAEPLFQRSLKIEEKALGKEHPAVATSLNDLAMFYATQGQYAAAEPLFQRSLKIWEKALGAEHPDVATSLNNLAVLYKAQGQYAAAEPLFQRSLKIWEKALGAEHPAVATSLNNLAALYEAQSQYSAAEPLYQQSLRTYNQLLESWLWGADEHTRQAYLKKQEGVRNAYLSFYAHHNTPEEALYFSLSRKGLLLRVASEVSALAQHSPDPAVQQQFQDFKALRAQLAKLYLSGKAKSEQFSALQSQSQALERNLSRLLSPLKQKNAEITSADVLKKLAPGQSLVDFLVFKEFDFKTNRYKADKLIALIANQQHGVQLVNLRELAPIAAAIQRYRQTITSNNRIKPIAQDLYQRLWQPLLPYLGNPKSVYLVPDGILHLLPFKALQDPSGAYLGQQVTLTALSSARDIVQPPLPGKPSAPGIVAGPDFGDIGKGRKPTTRGIDFSQVYFKALPAALDEGKHIHQLLKQKQPATQPKLLTQQQATETAVTAMAAPALLHLATHGFYLQDQEPDPKAQEHGLLFHAETTPPTARADNPLARSGLAFAGANLGVKGLKLPQASDRNDGILTALEVLNLDLRGTDLVTLSACDTGVGEIKTGEGVYSLNRAFQEAGAKAVLSTLWEVDDAATALFMEKFYTRFLDGIPPQQALQATQEEFISDPDYKDPKFWAGFVMMARE